MSNVATAAYAAIAETITPEMLEYERILKVLASKANFSRYPSDNKFHRQGKAFKSQKRRSNNRKRSK
jgi:hypothetical protein